MPRGGVDPILVMIKSKKKASHVGLLGQLKSIKPDLLHAIFGLREQGIQVNTFLLVVKALPLHECPFVCLLNGHARIAVHI